MTVLQIYLTSKEDTRQLLKERFSMEFFPAVSKQKGFISALLIQQADDDDQFQIVLTFVNEELRMKWVATEEHQQVFPRIREVCKQVSHKRFSLIS